MVEHFTMIFDDLSAVFRRIFLRPTIYVGFFESSFDTQFFNQISIVNHFIALCNQWFFYLVLVRMCSMFNHLHRDLKFCMYLAFNIFL